MKAEMLRQVRRVQTKNKYLSALSGVAQNFGFGHTAFSLFIY